jgi:hypothetical protein
MDAVVASADELPPPPQNPAGPAPLRRPGSVRRTSTIDMSWPDGREAGLQLVCRARDIYTPPDGGAPVVMAEDRARVRMAADRTILAIECDPPRAEVGRLVGSRGGGHLRHALEHVLPQDMAAGSPLYLLLDDLSGASLISSWAWSRWTEEPRDAPLARQMENICTGFRTGSSALVREGPRRMVHNCTLVPPLAHPDDPAGWHDVDDLQGVSMRRARRIDVWADDLIRIDSHFQDSASTPDGGRRMAVHEYLLAATIEPAAGTLLSVEADPRTLPYRECPTAAGNVGRLLGASARDLRQIVLVELAKTAGCTHLNDALRALAEAPILAEAARARAG